MNSHIRVFVFSILSLSLVAGSGALLGSKQTSPKLCTDEWFQYVEARLAITDAYGHGPDIGSFEWKSAVEYKLGIRGKSGIPDSGTRAWCEHIQAILDKNQ